MAKRPVFEEVGTATPVPAPIGAIPYLTIRGASYAIGRPKAQGG